MGSSGPLARSEESAEVCPDMAIGRTYPIKKNAVKAYGYTKPPKKRSSRSGPRYAANGSVTHVSASIGAEQPPTPPHARSESDLAFGS
jgi:hypothetical protein